AGEFTVANKPYPSNTKSTPENPTGWQLTVEHHRPHDRPTVFSKPSSLPPKISNSLAANQISAVDSWMTSSCKCDQPWVMHDGILIESYANAMPCLNPAENLGPGPQSTNPHWQCGMNTSQKQLHDSSTGGYTPYGHWQPRRLKRMPNCPMAINLPVLLINPPSLWQRVNTQKYPMKHNYMKPF